MKKSFLSLTLLAAALGSASADTLYYDTFNRGSSDAPAALTGTAPYPTDTASETWTAGSDWTTDGTSANTSDAGAAFLPLDITAGNIYTISADLTATSGQWVALGFAQNESNTADWIIGNGAGPWLLLKPNNDIQTFAGGPPGYGGELTGSSTYSGDGTQGSNFSIKLDTTAADYVATFSDGNTVLGTYTYTGASGSVPNPADLYVGFGAHGSTDGSVSDFKVVVTPEPATVGMLVGGLGALAFLVRRKLKA
jgi:hypothetical protein